MKKLVILLSTGVMCLGLSACAGVEFDPGAINEMTRSVEEVTAAVDDMQTYVKDIQSAVQEGIDNTNAAMEWYKTDAWAGNPWISPPITEEKVEGIIEAGQKEINSYIGENASYDVLSDDDIDYFNELFNDPSANGFLLSTYEKPEACNVYEVLKRDSDIIKRLSDEEKDIQGAADLAGRINAEDIDRVLKEHLGIVNSELNKPAKLSKSSGEEYLYIDEQLECRELICNGGFFYNNLYVVMMKDVQADTPFSLTALSKLDDGNIRIHMNYWSDDMADVDWDGSFLYDLYDLMQDTDMQKLISLPGFNGDVSLGSVIEDASVLGIEGKDVADVAKLISDKKDEAKTYVQAFDGYEVYYSNMDPKAVGEYVVSQIDVTGGDFKTAEGIGIGSSLEDIADAYGEGIEAKLSGGKSQVMYEQGKYSMLFILDKAGEVEEMSMFLKNDEPQNDTQEE